MPSPPSERASDRSPWVKSSKTAREQFRRDADAGIAHPDDRVPSLEAAVQLDAAAGLGVLGRVGQQVDDDLLEPGRVGLDHDSFAARSRRESRGSAPRSADGRTTTPNGGASPGRFAGGGAGSYPA